VPRVRGAPARDYTSPPVDRVLVTGGAGFVGGSVAVALARRHPEAQVVAFDNLSRRGSELQLPRLRAAGVRFVHGDVRELGDLQAVDEVSAIVECSAEPSVMAGVGSSPEYLVRTNLGGAFNCLELARRDGAQVVFLSTSRVYPIRSLLQIRLEETETRFEVAGEQELPGVGPTGIAETFPLEGARTLYGATKLAAELLVAEYAEVYGLRTVVDRFGVIAGPWQMGKVDQGVFTYWMLAHLFGRPLKYLGFAGSGRQVRDLLHIDDAVDLVTEQLDDPDRWAGAVVNAGGGREVSLSLRETTELCAEISGRRLEVEADGSERAGDIPLYLSDCSRLHAISEWRPQRSAAQVLSDIFEWASAHERTLRSALGS
jgi:CDP-paratose 2-epimerase